MNNDRLKKIMSIAAIQFVTPSFLATAKNDDTFGGGIPSLMNCSYLKSPMSGAHEKIFVMSRYGDFQKLISKFNSDIIRLHNYVGANYEALETCFNASTLSLLFEIKPDKIAFSLTSSDSIFYKLLKENFIIDFEVFYVNDGEDNIEVVYSIEENGKTLARNYGSLTESIRQIKETISSDLTSDCSLDFVCNILMSNSGFPNVSHTTISTEELQNY